MAQWRLPRPSLGARCLLPLSWLYGALSAARRAMYGARLLHSRPAPCPVVVVGNLVAGGAGKTPTVMALVQWLQRQGHKPGVISRGHARQGRGTALVVRNSAALDVGDEPLLIQLRTGVPVAVGRDRVAAAHLLCAHHPEIDVLVSDDGLQHLGLQRAIEVLLFDDRGAGNGLLLPAGPLRQPVPAGVAPNALVLYTAGRSTTPLPGYLGQRQLTGIVRLSDWWRDPLASPQALSLLAGRGVLAAAGLARPEAFFDMLEAAGLQIQRLPLPDHDALLSLPWAGQPGDVIVTEKDAVKLRPDREHCARVWVARLDFVPEPAFYTALLALLQRFAYPTRTTTASPS